MVSKKASQDTLNLKVDVLQQQNTMSCFTPVRLDKKSDAHVRRE